MHRIFVVGVLAAVIAVAACSTSNAEQISTTALVVVTSTTQDPPTTTTSETETTTTVQQPSTATLPISELKLTLTEVGSGFDHPVLLVADPGGGADLVVEQPGRIVRADAAEHVVVLDIASDVRFGGEQGLLGLAFHPGFDANRLAYVNYTDNRGRTVIEEFQVRDGVFDIESRLVILRIGQPAGNHNGGMIAFGPEEYLWIGMGDGGASNDRFGHGQDPHTLLGSMVRISVPGDGPDRYAIPPDNPFADGVGGAREVYAIGLRNPWRFSFDLDKVWIADVGQERIEEVNVVPAASAGLNFGWPIMEGSECFRSSGCDASGLTLPVTQYRRDQGCSITGGHVYRGDLIPELDGHYFFADFCSGTLWSYAPEGSMIDWTESTGALRAPSAFGIGGDGELYVVSHRGSIFRIERSA